MRNNICMSDITQYNNSAFSVVILKYLQVILLYKHTRSHCIICRLIDLLQTIDEYITVVTEYSLSCKLMPFLLLSIVFCISIYLHIFIYLQSVSFYTYTAHYVYWILLHLV